MLSVPDGAETGLRAEKFPNASFRVPKSVKYGIIYRTVSDSRNLWTDIKVRK